MNFKNIFGFNSSSSLRTVTDSGFIIPFDSDILLKVRELRLPMLHSGRTDRYYGHNDNENDSALGGIFGASLWFTQSKESKIT